MNLNAYDEITNKIDKRHTWIDVRKKQILSREIKFRPYYTITKRYNPQTEETNYFIILLDEEPYKRICYKTKVDDYGRIKLNVAPIWFETILSTLNKDVNIHIELSDTADDADVYKLDI